MCSHLSFNCLFLHKPTSSICHLAGKKVWGSFDILVSFSPLFGQSHLFFSFMTLCLFVFWHLPPPSNCPIAHGFGLPVRKLTYCDIHYTLGCQGGVGWPGRLKGVPLLSYPPSGPFLKPSQKDWSSQLEGNGVGGTVLLWQKSERISEFLSVLLGVTQWDRDESVLAISRSWLSITLPCPLANLWWKVSLILAEGAHLSWLEKSE